MKMSTIYLFTITNVKFVFRAIINQSVLSQLNIIWLN